MSMNCQIIKQTGHIHTADYWLLLSNKKEQIIDPHNNLDESPVNHAEWKSQSKKAT